MTTFYVRTTRGTIINAIEAHSRADAELVLDGFEGDGLRLDANPPLEALRAYPYWEGRP